MVGLAMCQLRHESKGDKDRKEEKKTLDEEGPIGYMMERKLKRVKQAGRRKSKSALPRVYTPSDRYKPIGMSV